MKTFNYAPASPLRDNLTMLAVSVGMVVGPIVYPFGIRIGSTRVLGPLPTAVLFIAGGILLLAMTVRKILRARALAAHGCKITVEGGRVTYPVIRKGCAEEKSFAIAQVETTRYEDEEGELTVRLKDGTDIVLQAGFFDTFEEYEAFAALLGKKE